MKNNSNHNNNSKSYSMDKQSAKMYDNNGYFLVKDNPISKSGVFEYLGKNIPDAPNPEQMYKVYRPESELNNPETINSFKLIPIIDDHEMLGRDATPVETKGMHGVTGEDIYFKDGVLYANLKVHSEALKNKIENGKKELSCGFYNEWTPKRGVTSTGESYDYIQTDIRANHLALVDAGRMGKDVAVLDSKDISNKGIIMDEELKKYLDDIVARLANLEAMEKKEEETKVEVSEDEEVTVSEDMEAKSEDECSEDEEAKSEDEETKKDEKSMDKKDTVKAPVFDAEDFKKQIRQEFSQKQKLHDQLKSHIGSFDHLEMSLSDVAMYGAKKLGMSCDGKDALATVNGYLAAAKVDKGVVSNSMDTMDNADNSVSKYLRGE